MLFSYEPAVASAAFGVKRRKRVPAVRFVKRVLRPVYRLFFERPLWWFLAKVKAFFLAEVGVEVERSAQRLAAIEERLRSTEANNNAQWNALEQLLLAMFRQPEARHEVGETSVERQDKRAASAMVGQDPYERNNLR